MRKLFILAILAAMLFAVTGQAADAVNWKGYDWGTYDGSIAVDSSGNLVVTAPSAGAYGGAHINIPSIFRNSPTQWVQISYIDELHSGGQIWLEDESAPDQAWTQFGTWAYSSQPNYRTYVWDVEPDTSVFTTEDARTSGEHTLKIGKRADSTIDYWLDGNLVHSTSATTWTYFGDVYLAARQDGANFLSTTFTDFQMGTDYSAPAAVPEPATILGFGIPMLMVGLGKLRGLRK